MDFHQKMSFDQAVKLVLNRKDFRDDVIGYLDAGTGILRDFTMWEVGERGLSKDFEGLEKKY